MISPINLQSADVVNLFYSSNLLLSQLLGGWEGELWLCVSGRVFQSVYSTNVLSMWAYVGVCLRTCVSLCVFVTPVPTWCGVRAKEQVEHEQSHAQQAKLVISVWTAATTGRDQTLISAKFYTHNYSRRDGVCVQVRVFSCAVRVVCQSEGVWFWPKQTWVTNLNSFSSWTSTLSPSTHDLTCTWE